MSVTLTTGDEWDDEAMRPAEQEHPDPQRVSALRAIRLKCGSCMGGEHDRLPLGEIARAVDECGSALCPLHPFRFGRDPWRAPPTDAQREAARVNALRMRGALSRSNVAGSPGDEDASGAVIA